MSKPTHRIELQPFSVPNYVIAVMPPRPRQEGIIEPPKFHLSELSTETLELLCKDFRDAVMAKAAKPREEDQINRLERELTRPRK